METNASHISWPSLAVVTLVVASLGLISCSTCPSVEKDSLKQSKRKQIETFLTSSEWETVHCLGYTEDEGKSSETKGCMNQLGNRRWIFKEGGTGSYLDEGVAGGTEWTEFDWKLDGDVLKLEEDGALGTKKLKVLSHGESKVELQRKSCSVSVLKPYES